MSASDSTQIQVSRAFQRRYEEGEIIFDEGEEGTDLFVVQAGRVQISRKEAGERRVVAQLEPGDFFGEMSVVLGEARTARATALGQTTLLILDGETLESMCIERPEIAIRMIQRLAIRLVSAERKLAAQGLDDLVSPVVRFLGQQASSAENDEVRLTTSLRELAANCELSLNETHQALHQLMDQKLIRLAGEELIAPDAAALAQARSRFERAPA